MPFNLMRKISLGEARKKFADIINQIAYKLQYIAIKGSWKSPKLKIPIQQESSSVYLLSNSLKLIFIP